MEKVTVLMPDCVYRKYKGKKVTVPWSGGFDSTAMVVGLAAAGAEVIALSVTSNNLPNVNHETFARTKLINILKTTTLVNNITFTTFHMPDISGDTCWPNTFHYNQRQLWMSILPLIVSPSSSEVILSFVGEDNNSYIPEMQKQWDSNLWNVKTGRVPKLTFPLQKVSKIDIHKSLEAICTQYKIQLLKTSISFCDKTTKVGTFIFSCGECSSCQASAASSLSYLQPMGNVRNTPHALKWLIYTAEHSEDCTLFRIAESEKVFSYYLSVEVAYGDGTEKHYNLDNPITITRDLNGIVFLGMGTDAGLQGTDFDLVENLPSELVFINKKEYETRHLSYLQKHGYTDIDLTTHLDKATSTK
jgi:7-cyano-7-deazaguanine synthase in queuosine biosynthesis